MSLIARFAVYAAAFEKAFESDDWSLVAPFFRDDAVYEARLRAPLGGRFEGRDAIVEYFQYVLNRFDRRFEQRELALLDGPKEQGDSVWLRGSATYTSPGVPPLVLVLEETITFAGEQICRLCDDYEPEMLRVVDAYLLEHGPKLGIVIE